MLYVVAYDATLFNFPMLKLLQPQSVDRQDTTNIAFWFQYSNRHSVISSYYSKNCYTIFKTNIAFWLQYSNRQGEICYTIIKC